MGGIVLVFNVFLQAGLGFSPWHSALTTAPWAAGAFAGSAAGGMSMHRRGRRLLHAGLGVEAAGLPALAAVLHQPAPPLPPPAPLPPPILPRPPPCRPLSPPHSP